jgi:hypothetical protein
MIKSFVLLVAVLAFIYYAAVVFETAFGGG